MPKRVAKIPGVITFSEDEFDQTTWAYDDKDLELKPDADDVARKAAIDRLRTAFAKEADTRGLGYKSKIVEGVLYLTAVSRQGQQSTITPAVEDDDEV